MRWRYMCLIILVSFIAGFSIESYSSELIDPGQGTPDIDGKTVWYDTRLLGVEGKGWLDTESDYDRLPLKAKGVVNRDVWELSHCTAGLQICFVSDAESLKVHWSLTDDNLDMPHMPATGVSGIDLYARDKTGKLRFCENGRPEDTSNTVLFTLPRSSEYVLYLPLYNGVKRLELGIPRESRLSRLARSSVSSAIVFYGTSITQGGCASRPGMAATSIVGRELDVPVINLGFSGSGKMEKELAELLAEINPAVYVLDCLWNMSPEMVSERVEPFIAILRKARPMTPILLVEDSNFMNVPTEKGELLRKIYVNLKARGDENLYLLSNTGMLGEDADGTVDGCHPNDLGMARQASVFIECLEPILKKQNLNKSDTGNDK
jgi:lysophospholipase L1-like esterase